jgi:nucleoside-diphosphate-sugar epimerase
LPSGYYRYPTLNNDTVIFVCEDDLWTLPATGSASQRASHCPSHCASQSPRTSEGPYFGESPRSFALRKAPVPLRFAKPPFLRGSLFWGQRVPILGTEGPDFKDPGEGEIILMDETHTWNIRPERYPYGYAKYLAELEVQKEVALGLDAVIVNPGLVLGPGDIHRGSSSILLQVAKRKLGVSMEGGLNVVHLQDVVTGHIKALEYGRTGERYILGGENLTHTEFLKILARVTGTPPNFIELPAALVRALRLPALFFEHFIDLPVSAELFTLAGCAMFCDTRKARNELGLPAPLSVEQAAAEAYAWFRGE